MKHLKISVCVIGLNEEARVGDCLASVQSVADEIIFVDSQSKDRTTAIVRKHKGKVFQKKFKDYVDQKNFAASKAKYDWILNLDCDERLSTELAHSIQRIKQTFDVKADLSAAKFNRKTWYIYRWIKHSGWYPDEKIRLYDRTKAEWRGEGLHEYLHVQSGKTIKLKGDLLHYSFGSIDDHLSTIRKYSEIAANESYARGKRTQIPFIFLRAFWVGLRKMLFEFAFLDGFAGWLITYYSMVATFTKYTKLYLLQKGVRLSRKDDA